MDSIETPARHSIDNCASDHDCHDTTDDCSNSNSSNSCASSLPTALERLHSSLLEKYHKIDEYSVLYASQQQKIDALRTQLGDAVELTKEQMEVAKLRHRQEELTVASEEQIKRQKNIQTDMDAKLQELMRVAELHKSLLSQNYQNMSLLNDRRAELNDTVNMLFEQRNMVREELWTIRYQATEGESAGAKCTGKRGGNDDTLDGDGGSDSREYLRRLLQTTQSRRIDLDRQLNKVEKRHTELSRQVQRMKQEAAYAEKQQEAGFRPQVHF